MRNAFLYLLLIFFGSSFQPGKLNTKRWVIVSGCSLKVDGSTNINNFSCVITNYSEPDTIVVGRKGDEAVQLNGNIRLDVQRFDCHNPVMTADLRKTLKAKEFPKLIITFISMNKYPVVGKSDDTKGTVLINLAGVSKRFEVDYKVLTSESQYISMVGTRKVNFTDFNLIPPRKIGGMIRTDNELSVSFNIKMKVLD